MGLSDFFPALFENYFIKLIFLVHTTLVSIAGIASHDYSTSQVYIFYNSIFIITVLLAILVDKSPDIALVATCLNAISVVLDILLLIAGYYPGLVTILVIVLNLALRAPTTVLLLRNYSIRAGVDDPTSGFLEVNLNNAAPQTRSAYQNIDEPNQTLP